MTCLAVDLDIPSGRSQVMTGGDMELLIGFVIGATVVAIAGWVVRFRHRRTLARAAGPVGWWCPPPTRRHARW
ncbi:MAG: LapA family protein [Actinomycetota bacterium]|nr:LapA family protein [Actinomycetota bacterium]